METGFAPCPITVLTVYSLSGTAQTPVADAVAVNTLPAMLTLIADPASAVPLICTPACASAKLMVLSPAATDKEGAVGNTVSMVTLRVYGRLTFPAASVLVTENALTP